MELHTSRGCQDLRLVQSRASRHSLHPHFLSSVNPGGFSRLKILDVQSSISSMNASGFGRIGPVETTASLDQILEVDRNVEKLHIP